MVKDHLASAVASHHYHVEPIIICLLVYLFSSTVITVAFTAYDFDKRTSSSKMISRTRFFGIAQCCYMWPYLPQQKHSTSSVIAGLPLLTTSPAPELP